MAINVASYISNSMSVSSAAARSLRLAEKLKSQCSFGSKSLNASKILNTKLLGEKILHEAIKAPFKTILHNAGLKPVEPEKKGLGVNVVTGNMVNMIDAGIIDPLLVTKSALQNAASVATTILSTDCVINNLRIDEGNR